VLQHDSERREGWAREGIRVWWRVASLDPDTDPPLPTRPAIGSLIRDQYGNYVVQRALQVASDIDARQLVAAIRYVCVYVYVCVVLSIRHVGWVGDATH
jgi:hypothetical protein